MKSATPAGRERLCQCVVVCDCRENKINLPRFLCRPNFYVQIASASSYGPARTGSNIAIAFDLIETTSSSNIPGSLTPMSRKVVIQNVKQIDQLEFDIPPPGVHIISGTNGSGKSCLLTCLLRIGRPNAFQNFFLTSRMSDALDGFDGAKITYSVNNNAVTYAYTPERWSPRPKKNSKLLKSFGYPSVIYAAANAERIEPRAEDFKPKYVRDASDSIKTAAKLILGDEKFDHLKIVNVRRGVGAEAYLMPDSRGTHKKTAYYSEKNFSLGEICVLKLLRQLDTCPHHSLVLIDELELALHPRAQIGLLRYLEEISAEKNLTVIFSTHSANLIKTAKRENSISSKDQAGKRRSSPNATRRMRLGCLLPVKNAHLT